MTLPRIILITDEKHPDGLVAPILKAIDGRSLPEVHVQLRAKATSDHEFLSAATSLKKELSQLNIPLMINGRVDVAMAVDAAGVHLPTHGISALEVRKLLPDALISRACHTAFELKVAFQENANYALLSPLFHVEGKSAPLGKEQFTILAKNAFLPVFALGGVTPDFAPESLKSGAYGVAVIRSVLFAANPRGALDQFLYVLSHIDP